MHINSLQGEEIEVEKLSSITENNDKVNGDVRIGKVSQIFYMIKSIFLGKREVLKVTKI